MFGSAKAMLDTGPWPQKWTAAEVPVSSGCGMRSVYTSCILQGPVASLRHCATCLMTLVLEAGLAAGRLACPQTTFRGMLGTLWRVAGRTLRSSCWWRLSACMAGMGMELVCLRGDLPCLSGGHLAGAQKSRSEPGWSTPCHISCQCAMPQWWQRAL